MIRNCLKCQQPFESQHIANRLCPSCKAINNHLKFDPPPSRQGRVIKKLGGAAKDGFGERSDE